MKRKKSEMIAIDPEGFYAEYKRIAKAFGGVEALSEKVAPTCHSHYLSVAKRQAKIAKYVFNNLVELGADKDTMLGTKPKAYAYNEVAEIMYDYLTKLVTSDEFRKSFIQHSSLHLRKAVKERSKK